METSVQPHWLAVEGSQPATAENAQPRRAAAARDAVARGRPAAALPNPAAASGPAAPPPAAAASGAARQGAEAGGLTAGLPLRHALPEELQLYYDMVRRTLQADAGVSTPAGRAVAASLASDPGAPTPADGLAGLGMSRHVPAATPWCGALRKGHTLWAWPPPTPCAGLQPMLPYLVPLLAQEVGRSLGNVQHLRMVLRCARGAVPWHGPRPVGTLSQALAARKASAECGPFPLPAARLMAC